MGRVRFAEQDLARCSRRVCHDGAATLARSADLKRLYLAAMAEGILERVLDASKHGDLYGVLGVSPLIGDLMLNRVPVCSASW